MTDPYDLPMQELDPVVMRILAAAPPPGNLHASPVAAVRAGYRAMTLETEAPDATVTVSDRSVPGGDGTPRAARMYAPGSVGSSARVLFFHGGGFLMGDLETHDGMVRRLAAASGLRWIACDYRLAPEHRHPAAIEDALAAAAWALDEARRDGVALILAGDSAGAYLAAHAALALCRGGQASLGALALFYPFVAFDHDAPSRHAYRDGPFIAASDLAYLRQQFLGDAPERSLIDEDLAILPSTLVVTAGHDPLRDDGLAIARAISNANVRVVHLHFPALIHAFGNFAHLVPAADVALASAGAALAELAAA